MKKLFMLDLIPACIVSVIMGSIVLFDEIPQFLMFIPVLCMGIHTFILPLYYVGTFWVMHFDYGLGCVKGALGTIFAGFLSGILFYGIADVFEAIRTGIIRFFFTDSEHLAVMLLPEAIIIPGVIIVMLISLISRLGRRK